MRIEPQGERVARTRWIDAIIDRIARRQHSVVGRRQLLRAGVSSNQIARRLRSGRLVALFRGVYLVASPVPPDRHLEMAALLAAGRGAAISHLPAARIRALELPRGMRDRPGGPVDVTLAGVDRAARRGLRLHSTPLSLRWETTLVGSLRVTTAARTILDLVPALGDRELEQLVAEALRNRRVLRPALELQVERSVGRAGVKRLRRLLDGGRFRMTRSVAEELLLEVLARGGVEPPLTNARVEGRELDAYWPDERVGIELQSWGWHGFEEALEADVEKAGLFGALGYTVLPFTVAQLERSPELVVGRTRAALERVRRDRPG